MPILRKVYFRDARGWINQRADALDRFESDVGNILRPQPFQNRSALKRDGQAAQFSHVEMAVAVWENPQLSVDQFSSSAAILAARQTLIRIFRPSCFSMYGMMR